MLPLRTSDTTVDSRPKGRARLHHRMGRDTVGSEAARYRSAADAVAWDKWRYKLFVEPVTYAEAVASRKNERRSGLFDIRSADQSSSF